MKSKEYQALRTAILLEIERLEKKLAEAREQVQIPGKSFLREMTGRDVFVGQIVFYLDENRWCTVEQVISVNNPTRAFVADDGGRYGLRDAFVYREI